MSSGVTPCFRPPSVIAMFVDTGVRMPISRAILAMLRVPTLMPTSAKTELSEWRRGAFQRRDPGVGALEVVDDELLVGIGAVGDVEELLARLPRRIRVDALAQRRGEHEGLAGGPRLALALRGQVERRLLELLPGRPPTIARTSPVWLSIATSAAAGPLGLERCLFTASSAAFWRSRSSVVLIFRPPLNAFVTPKRSTTCPLHPRGEVRRPRVLARGLDGVARGQRLSDRCVVLALRDVVLVEHLGQREVAPVLRRDRDAPPGRRRRARRSCPRAAPPGPGSSCGAQFGCPSCPQPLRSLGRSRCARPTRCRTPRYRNRSSSGTR